MYENHDGIALLDIDNYSLVLETILRFNMDLSSDLHKFEKPDVNQMSKIRKQEVNSKK